MAEIHVAAWRAAYSDVMDQAFLAGLKVTDRRAMWERALSSPGQGYYLVGLLEGVVRGFCVCGPARDAASASLTGPGDAVGELVALNVEPRYWGCGVGYCLARDALTYLENEKYDVVYLWVVESNERAISLYERLGFKCAGVTKQDAGNSITEVRFELHL